MTPGRCEFAQASTDRSIDGFLEGDAELPRAPLQQSRQIVTERKGCSLTLCHRCISLWCQDIKIRAAGRLRLPPASRSALPPAP